MTDLDKHEQMRGFIMATEQLNCPDESPIVETESPPVRSDLMSDLEHIIFKLRAFMESSGGDYAFGVEIGMQRAADMIEHAIERHGGHQRG